MRNALLGLLLLSACAPSSPAGDAATTDDAMTSDAIGPTDVASADAATIDATTPPADGPTADAPSPPTEDAARDAGGPSDAGFTDASTTTDASTATDASTRLTVTSTAFADNATIPPRHASVRCGPGAMNLSPPLAWTGAPPDTRSFAIIMDDPDAPGGTFTHWLVWNIPGTRSSLPQGVLPADLPQGRNGFGNAGYDGPCPPPPTGEHRYSFRVYALSAPSLDVPPGASPAAFATIVERSTIARGELVGRYRQ